MSKSRRILLIFGIAAVLCLAYLWFFGVATMFALEARYVAWKIPMVKKTPVELPDQSIAQGAGRKLEYFGYEFEVPWEIDEAKSKELGQYNPQPRKEQFIAFRSGNRLTVFRIAPREFVNGFLSMGKAVETRCASPDGDDEASALKWLTCDLGAHKALYGEDVLQSDYSFKEGVLKTTPDKVGLLAPRKEAAASAMLLVIKGIMMSGGTSPASTEFGQETSEVSNLVIPKAAGHSSWRFITKRADSPSFSRIRRTALSRQSLRQRSTALSNP